VDFLLWFINKLVKDTKVFHARVHSFDGGIMSLIGAFQLHVLIQTATICHYTGIENCIAVYYYVVLYK